MTAVSAEPGTWFGLQFVAALQLPPLVLVRVIVAARPDGHATAISRPHKAARARAADRTARNSESSESRRGSRVDDPTAYHAEGILYLPAEARFDYLLNRPVAENIGAKVNAAMRDIEKHNPQLAGVLPKTYNLFTSTLLKELLKKVSEIPATVD